MRFATLLLCGCNGTVTMIGTVEGALDAGEPAGGVRVVVHGEDFDVVDEATTAPDGAFEVQAPRGSEIHVVIEGDGLVPVAFRGESGLDPEYRVPPGTFWAFHPADEARWRDDFAGCPGAEDGSGMIVGTLWPAIAVDDVTAGPPEPFGLAYVERLEEKKGTPVGGTRIDACYLEDRDPAEGPAAHDPDAVRTGRSGRFAIFGVEGGPWGLTLGRYVHDPVTGEGGILPARTTAFVPEGGVVHRHPGLVPL